MTLRAFGPLNGTLPQPTGQLVAFMRDPASYPYLRYAQLVPAPDINFSWSRLDPDEPVRLTELNRYAWAYDDYRPSGRDYTVKVEAVADNIQRWDFPWQLGEQTISSWKKSGVNVRQIYDRVRANHAQLHRAVRILNALSSPASPGWPTANISDFNTLMGTNGAYLDTSSGTQYLPDGTPNPNFQILRRMLQVLHRRIHLATNGAIRQAKKEIKLVIPPRVAEAIATSGEMVEFIKQSPYAQDLFTFNWDSWGLPDSYGGFEFVVEDTPRCFINQHADGTVSDITVPAQKDYILNSNVIYAISRSGGLDAPFGERNFSTVQVYHLGGEARVQAFTEPKHELVEGHIVMEDKVTTPALVAGMQITNVLSPAYQARF